MKHSNIGWIQASSRGTLLLLVSAGMFWIGARQIRPVQAGAGVCPAGQYCVYLPAIVNEIYGDLVLSGIEVTQSVQNSQGSVPLVAGRRTMLRIYAHTSDFEQPVSKVKISIQMSRPGSANGNNPPQIFSAQLPGSNSRADYNSTINFLLPDNWTQGTENITVKLDPDNVIPEAKKSNNVITLRLVFNPVPTLNIKIVPILYTNTKNGRTYAAPNQDDVSDWIMRTYPINMIQLSWHALYTFKGDLTSQSDWGTLLNDITTLKNSENASASQVYYGLIPTTDGSTPWFYGGIAGLGWIGSRAAIGLDLEGQTSQLAAHEIGHNLGMWHTPCGGAASPDPNYPYPDGTIGQYGLDISTGTLYLPGTFDVMGYCGPKWISDYTYKEIFNNQVHYGANLAQAQTITAGERSQRGLLVRANITASGADLLPAYVVPGQVTQAPVLEAEIPYGARDYQVQVLGENGQMLAQQPVRAYHAGDGDPADGNPDEFQIDSINTLIPLPNQPAAKLRLLEDGKVLAEQALQTNLTSQAPATGVTVEPTAQGDRLRWDSGPAAGQQPALVRYTTDGGKTWTTLSVDAAGGQLNLPPGALPENASFEVIQAGVWK